MKMKTIASSSHLHIDIETYCELDLSKVGVYAYASHPSFEILLLAYAYNNDPVTCIDLLSEDIPLSVLMDLESSAVVKVAHNAAFEMICLKEYLLLDIQSEQWECTMVMALQQGLPASLAQVGSVLSLEQQKMLAGTALINYFSKPCKPTRMNSNRIRNLPMHDIEKWEVFIEYCSMDVEVEQAIFRKLSTLAQPLFEKDIYVLDQEINRRGILVDHIFAENASYMDSLISDANKEELQKITGMSNPKSTPQFKQYLSSKGFEVKSFTKDTGPKLLESVKDEEVKRAIILKLSLSKSSVAKYDAMLRADSGDHRMRGMFQYYGGNRTGRWAGRLVQLQNLPQNHIEELDLARDLVLNKDSEMLEYLFDGVPRALSELIRTAFIAKEGHKFIVADYSAIEARVIAWLAKEKWRMDVFNTHGKIYEASASQMFKVPIEEVTKGSPLRQKGKVAELALGYGGGIVALKQMKALEMGITEEELPKIVKLWRTSSKNIYKLWYDVEGLAMDAIENPTKKYKLKQENVFFKMSGLALIVTLPSGRFLCYQNAKIVSSPKGPKIEYNNLNQTSKKWERTDTWGGKLVENITQAIARDCLAFAMLRLNKQGYEIVGHVHDEVIIEAPIEANVEDVCVSMSAQLPWAQDLYLTADGYETTYYKKD